MVRSAPLDTILTIGSRPQRKLLSVYGPGHCVNRHEPYTASLEKTLKVLQYKGVMVGNVPRSDLKHELLINPLAYTKALTTPIPLEF